MVNAAPVPLSGAPGVPRSLEDLQLQEHLTIHFSTMLGARPYGMEYSGRRTCYGDASGCQVRYTSTARRPRSRALDAFACVRRALGDWADT